MSYLQVASSRAYSSKPSSAGTLPQHKRTKSALLRNREEEGNFNQRQAVKKQVPLLVSEITIKHVSLVCAQGLICVSSISCRLPEFGSILESVLENTLTNTMQGAFAQEFNITSRPRLVALPPKSTTPRSQHSAGSMKR